MTDQAQSAIVDGIFQKWFDGLITEQEAVSIAIINGVHNAVTSKITSWRIAHPQPAKQPDRLRSANFSRHHYVWLAQALGETVREVETNGGGWLKIVHGLTNRLADDNPNFNKKMFLNNIFVQAEETK
jgi:hypothetical protein